MKGPLCLVFVQQGTKFVILRRQTFDEARVTSDSAHRANKESLSAFVEDGETSVSVGVPEDEERVGEVLDWFFGSLGSWRNRGGSACR